MIKKILSVLNSLKEEAGIKIVTLIIMAIAAAIAVNPQLLAYLF